MQELRTWLPASVKLVHLPLGEDAAKQATQNYLIRSQPDAACMSTMEATARCGGYLTRPSHLLHDAFQGLKYLQTMYDTCLGLTCSNSCCRALGFMECDPSVEAGLLKPLLLMTALQVKMLLQVASMLLADGHGLRKGVAAPTPAQLVTHIQTDQACSPQMHRAVDCSSVNAAQTFP